MTVLIVEDNLSLQQTLAMLLRNIGCDITCTNRLSEAREIMAAQVFDVLLVDLGLPNGNGCELMRECKCRKIVLTGWTDGPYWQEALSAGAEKILPKPVSERALLQAISEGGGTA